MIRRRCHPEGVLRPRDLGLTNRARPEIPRSPRLPRDAKFGWFPRLRAKTRLRRIPPAAALRGGQPERERRPLPQFAAHLDPPLVMLDDLPADRQPQAGAL